MPRHELGMACNAVIEDFECLLGVAPATVGVGQRSEPASIGIALGPEKRPERSDLLLNGFGHLGHSVLRKRGKWEAGSEDTEGAEIVSTHAIPSSGGHTRGTGIPGGRIQYTETALRPTYVE